MPALPVISGRDSSILEDPLLGFNFMLQLDGALAGYFTECSGISSENEVVEHKVVDEGGHEIVRKIPGRLKFEDVSLKRGITSDLQIWQWRENVVLGDMAAGRKNCSIHMLDRNYNPVAIWHFTNAWPTKVSGPQMKSDSNEFGIEEITITHEGLYREL